MTDCDLQSLGCCPSRWYDDILKKTKYKQNKQLSPDWFILLGFKKHHSDSPVVYQPGQPSSTRATAHPGKWTPETMRFDFKWKQKEITGGTSFYFTSDNIKYVYLSVSKISQEQQNKWDSLNIHLSLISALEFHQFKMAANTERDSSSWNFTDTELILIRHLKLVVFKIMGHYYFLDCSFDMTKLKPSFINTLWNIVK